MNPALENIKYVVENSKHVSIDYAKLKEFCAGITESDIAPKSVPAPFDLVGADTLSRVDFAVIFNSVNFCYWGSPKWTIEHDGKHYDGAAAMAIALRRAMDNGYPILSAGYLKNMSEKDLRNILEGNVEIPLFGQRLANLKETGRVLSERYDGHFFGWLKRVDNDALRLVDVLTKDMSPKTIDWDMFLGYNFECAGEKLGPTPKEMPFDRAVWAQWRCYWDFGGGMFTDLFVHRTTRIISAMGVRYPARVVRGGGIYLEYDGRDVPDVATVVADYDEGCQVII